MDVESKSVDLRNKSLFVLVQVREDTLTEIFRKIMKDARTLGFRKIFINVVSQLPHWQVLANAREAILDNIDLGLVVYTWRPDETKKILEKVTELGADGIMTYCDEESKFAMSKLMGNLPSSIKIGIVKDNCK
ncbi:DUF5751 family protein [Metallosphaera hakonensis]|uniref:DUF5751 domain-containing protein n=1 Tax=Metallosphaera hakonensis JCM 8857 = DSM 7519 TaxID=1293036 RepID=A0A2U9IS63_9CREN|nr:DUF5751 family protein [Metallosphaera hakonensis]AWR98856.1 hypothetical protein DFR87_03155 [Metallosphaera hakonensis JCM 8857 = DSM 7519]